MSLAPLRVRAFRRLLCCYGVNQLGDWAGEVALAVAVFTATGSPLAVAATWMVHRCGFGLLAPMVVARLEHLRRARLLGAVYGLEAVVFVALAIGAPAGLVVILPLVAVDGLLAPAARALARSAVVDVTRPAGLHREGNALINVVFTANGVLAPALGGLMVAATGPAAVLLIDAASFAAVAAVMAGCRLPSGAATPSPQETGVRRLRDALSYVAQRPVLRGLLGGEAALSVFLAAILPIEVVFVTDTLGASNAAFGAVLTAWGLGMVLGGVAAARLTRAPLRVMLLGAGTAQAAAYLGMGVSGTVAAVLVWSTIGGIGNGIYGMAIVTAIQERASDAYQARVNGLLEALISVGTGLGFALGGTLATLVSTRAVYLAAGAGAIAVLAWAAAQLRDADWAPAPITVPA
jgi:predicted MFS family arabinose efflux permease